MKKYDYRDAICEDIRTWISENYNSTELKERLNEEYDEVFEEMNDALWVEDSVTGNGSGSYYCNAWKAAEAIAHNWDLLKEALCEFGCTDDVLERGEEWADVTIRCYLLGECLNVVLNEYK